MNIDLDLGDRRILAAWFRTAPKEIARAERSAINKTGRRIRNKTYLPGVQKATKLPNSQVRRSIVYKTAGRRRKVGIIQVSGRRIPLALWRWRVVPVDPLRAFIQVQNDINGRWINIYAIANPAGRRLPFARWDDEVIGASETKQYVSGIGRYYLIGASPRRVFGQLTDKLIDRQEISEALRDEFFAALERQKML